MSRGDRALPWPRRSADAPGAEIVSYPANMETLWNIVWAVVGGAIIGIIARLLLPGRQRIPFWAVIGAGIIGMFVGDWLANLLGVKETFGFDWIRHGLQIVVAVAAVAAVAAIFSRLGGGSTATTSNVQMQPPTVPSTINPPTIVPPAAGAPTVTPPTITPPGNVPPGAGPV